MSVTQIDKGNAFRALPSRAREPFIMANAWDAGIGAHFWRAWGFFRHRLIELGRRPTSYGRRDQRDHPRGRRLAPLPMPSADATDLPVLAPNPRKTGSVPRPARCGRNVTVRPQPRASSARRSKIRFTDPTRNAPVRHRRKRPSVLLQRSTPRVSLDFPFFADRGRADGFLHGHNPISTTRSRRLQALRKRRAPTYWMAPGLPDPQLGEDSVCRDHQALQLHGWHPWQIVRPSRSSRRPAYVASASRVLFIALR